MMDISDEQLQGMNDDIKFAVMALKCSDGNMEVSEKMIIFEKIDEITEFNQAKVLDAFYENKIGEEHFYI